MFVNLATGQRGLVALWDAVAFDEAAGIKFTDKNGINIMKNYMEDGAFSRGRDIITAEGSVVFVGNIDGDIETIIRTSNLFYPMPKEMDTAFYDRIHAYLPGLGAREDARRAVHDPLRLRLRLPCRGVPGAAQDAATCDLRRAPLPLRAAPRRPRREGGPQDGVSGLVKLLHPDGDVAKDELAEYVELRDGDAPAGQGAAQEDGRAGVLGRNFSYVDMETGQETFVGLPRWAAAASLPRACFPRAASTRSAPTRCDNRLALFLMQTQMNPGSGRIIPARQSLATR